MSKELPKVELHSAFMFCCDSCGRDNYFQGIPATVEEIAELMEDGCLEMVPPSGVGMLRVPDEVECYHCQARFAVELPGDDEEDEEDEPCDEDE